MKYNWRDEVRSKDFKLGVSISLGVVLVITLFLWWMC